MILTRAAVVSGLLALGSTDAAFAQGAGSKPAQPPPAAAAPKAPAQPAAAAPAKPAAPAQPGAAAPSKPAAPAQPGAAGAGGKDAALKIYKDAEAKFDKGDCAGALPLYRQADATSPSPAPKYKIAVCLDKGGQVTDAVAAYQAFLDSKPDAQKFKDKIPEAQKRIDELKKTPAKVKVVTVPEAPPNLQITVDGMAQTSRELSLTPGRHQLTLKADGFNPATEEILVSYAETRDLPLTLVAQPATAPPLPAEPAAAPPPPEPAPAAPPPPAAPPREPSSPLPAYVSFGIAGAGLIVGTVFGIMALGDKSAYEEDMTTENLDALDVDATVADIGFATFIGFGVAGAVLFLNSQPSEPAKALVVRPKNKAFVAPYVGPTGGGAAARFTF